MTPGHRMAYHARHARMCGGRMPSTLKYGILALLPMLWIPGCRPVTDSADERLLGPAVPAEFSSIFVPVDTIRLDSDVLIGTISQTDVARSGNLLVSDRVSHSVYLFDSDGGHLRTLAPEECSPDAPPALFARFVFGNQILVSTLAAAYLFDSHGRCIRQITTLASLPESFCSKDDSLFVYHVSRVPRVSVYTVEFNPIAEIALPRPRNPQLVSVSRGFGGRLLQCSIGGVRYLYPDDSDARLIDADPQVVSIPDGYRRPPRAQRLYSSAELPSVLDDIALTSHTALGTYAVANFRRLIVFANPTANSGLNYLLNLVDASSGRSFSTMTSKGVQAALGNHVYFGARGDVTAAGEVTNPMLEVYRINERLMLEEEYQ